MSELPHVMDSPIEYIGPFETTAIVIDGWQVPYLDAEKDANGVVRFIHLDHRNCLQLPEATEDNPYINEILVRFIADCIAVASGYSCHPRPEWEAPIPLTPYRKMHGITVIDRVAGDSENDSDDV